MQLLINIILAKDESAKSAAYAALHKRNAELPSDREAIQSFLKDCTTLAGAPLTLDESGAVVTLQ